MTWRVAVGLAAPAIAILVTDEEGSDLLKARLPPTHHPRALVALVEGLALWSGEPIVIVISADEPDPGGYDDTFFGLDLWPLTNPLVTIRFVPPPEHQDRIDGLGDFSRLPGLEGGHGR